MGRKIVAINGTIGSGKDTFASAFIAAGYTRMSFAETLKDAVSVIFGWDREMLEGNTDESRKIRESKDEFWSQKMGRDVTPRWVLQNFGTDVVRKHFHDDIWVFALENKLRSIEGDVIITDCRFPNELKMLREHKADIIEVRRVLPHWYGLAIRYNTGHIKMLPVELEDVHRSEWAWIGINKPDHIIENNGTKEELYRKAEWVVHGINDSK